MLRTSDELRKYSLGATDGDIGSIRDVYFDDRAWVVRYLVADTGSWLEDKLVLVSPAVLGPLRPDQRIIETALTKAQIKACPPAESHRPVTDHLEVRYFPWFGWPPVYQPGGSGPQATEDVHLRSAEEVTGYSVEATDGRIGHVAGFLIDDDWVVRYLVIDSWDWLAMRHVLSSPEWVRRVDWNRYTVYVDLDREAIKGAPRYDPHAPVTRDYEAALCRYYGRRGYWAEQGCPTAGML